MVPLDIPSWLGEYWWVWLSFVTVALYIFEAQLSHGVLLAARLFAILRGCQSTIHTTAVTKNRALVRYPKLFSGTSNQFKEWVFLWSLHALRANVVRPGARAHEVDYAMSFLDGNARLWLLSCLERGHNFPDWVSSKSALAETFGPVEAEKEFRLALFSLCQTDSMSLEEYVSKLTRLKASVFRIWMNTREPYSLHEDYRIAWTRKLCVSTLGHCPTPFERLASPAWTCRCSTLVEDQTEWPLEQREFQPEERWLVRQPNPTRYKWRSDCNSDSA